MGDPDSLLLDLFYRGVTAPAEFASALRLLSEHFACRAAALVSVDALSPHADIVMSTGLFDEYGRLYLEQFIAIDPAPALFSRLPVGTASATNRMLTAEQLETEPFFQEFFRPIGLVETLGGHLYSDKTRFALVGFQRGPDRAEFNDAEISHLEHLMPHITRALQLHKAFASKTAMAAGLQAAVDRLHAGAVLLDSEGTALFVNAAMRAIVKRGDGFLLDRAGRPLPVNATARKHLDRLLAEVGNGGAGGTFAAPRANEQRDYIAVVAPSPSTLSDMQWERRGRAGALVLVHDPDKRTLAPADILQRGLHLPKGAAKLAAALAGDDDLRSFAEREGVTIHTARFHLHTALARTGARTQAELVRIAVRLLRDVALAGA